MIKVRKRGGGRLRGKYRYTVPPAEACHHKYRTGVSSHLLPVCSLLPLPNPISPAGTPN